MGRNGALSSEEWRPRWPPLWVHSTNMLSLTAFNQGKKLVLK
jgi:hypothetical protein